MSAVDDYLATLPGAERAAYEHVGRIVRATVPDAEEGISYGMPAFTYAGRPLLGIRAATTHLSLFPFSSSAVAAVRGRLEGFSVAKGTIRFTPDKPVPDDVLVDLVRARLGEIA
jgi:uncharacterized protein YdhG (YjbR/CyaY superfamily)